MLQFWYYIHFLKCEFFSARIQNGNNRIYQLFFIAFKRYQQYFSAIIISFLNKGTTALLCSKPQSSQNMGIGCWTTFFFCRRPSDNLYFNSDTFLKKHIFQLFKIFRIFSLKNFPLFVDKNYIIAEIRNQIEVVDRKQDKITPIPIFAQQIL